MSEYLQVMTTIDDREVAIKIVQTLVEARLAGCAQVVGPIQSTYWWKGDIESAEEWLCILKTSKSLYPELEAAIRQMHSYEVAEILASPVVAGNVDYLTWLSGELKQVK
ncbi:divalent-cation tolerance protein CutA [Chloroflexota bacterium]